MLDAFYFYGIPDNVKRYGSFRAFTGDRYGYRCPLLSAEFVHRIRDGEILCRLAIYLDYNILEFCTILL